MFHWHIIIFQSLYIVLVFKVDMLQLTGLESVLGHILAHWIISGCKNPASHLNVTRIFFKDFIYLFMRDTESEAETQAEGVAGSMQGAWCGTPSQNSKIMPWAEGRRSTPEPPGDPLLVEFEPMSRHGNRDDLPTGVAGKVPRIKLEPDQSPA